MTAGMADIIAAHTPVWECMGGNDDDRSWLECSCRTFANDDWTGDTEADHAAHVAEELAKAGYGNVPEAKREAWTEGFNSGWAEAMDPGAFVNDVWDSKTPNPYIDPLAAALADPEGHALVKAIHDRKAAK